MDEQRLPGGNAGGAVRVGDTVRRRAGPWTPSVHALLRHLEARGFAGAPRARGLDEQGREVVSFLPGTTVGDAKPWPAWVHGDAALLDVGGWLRRYHDAVAGFVPSPDASWRLPARRWQPGDVIGHNDAAPYNAVWRRAADGGDMGRGRLVGFIDWDFAAPGPALWDLAYVVFSWGPLHARDVVAAEGFTRFADRPRRIRLLLDAYRYAGTTGELLAAVRARVETLSQSVLALAAAGDPCFARMVADGAVDAQRRALAELDRDAESLRRTI